MRLVFSHKTPDFRRIAVEPRKPRSQFPTNRVQYIVRFAMRKANGFISGFTAPQVSRPTASMLPPVGMTCTKAPNTAAARRVFRGMRQVL